MTWNKMYPKSTPPNLDQIDGHIASALWQDLRSCLEEKYGVTPTVSHSCCSGAPGWNVKYRKSGRALCTLYPAEGSFTCLVTIGGKEAMEAEFLLAGCTDYVRELYWNCSPMNGGRWLMIEVTSPEILSDVKSLIGTRVKRKKTA